MVISLIGQKIQEISNGRGFLLDGFPRNLPQAESLKLMFEHTDRHLDKAILLSVSDEEVVRRLSGRMNCPDCNAGYNYPSNMPKQEGLCDNCGGKLVRRNDDDETVVRNRLEVYHNETQPIEHFYRNESILREIDGEKKPDEVFQDILAAIKE